MNKVYENACDQHVRCTIIYVGENGIAYADPEFTRVIVASELRDLFLKGAVINSDNTMYKPVVFVAEEDGFSTLGYIGIDGEMTTIVSAHEDGTEPELIPPSNDVE